MHSHLLFGALALAVPALCLPSDSASPPSVGGSAAMTPINVVDFGHALGIHRREAVQLSSMDLQTQEQVIYGRHGGPSHFNLLSSFVS